MDMRKVRALGKMLLKLETRSRTGSNRKLMLIYIAYLVPGLFIPWILIKQNSDPTGFEFAFLSFVLYSITICFTVINELDNIIISKSEAEVFTSLPVDDRVIISAKMYMMLRYFVFLCIPLLLPGTIFYFFLIHSVTRAFLYLISGFMLILFLSNVISLIYAAAIKILTARRISSVSLIFQVILIFALIISYQLVSYGITGRPGRTIDNYFAFVQAKGILDFFPQAWYALLPSKNNYALDIALILKIFLPILICQLSYISLKWYLEFAYPDIREKYLYARTISETGKPQRFFIWQLISNFIQGKYLINNLERSSYGLLASLYKRDKTVKMSIVAMTVIPAGLAIFALVINQLPMPFGEMALKPVFHISILLSILVALNTAIHSTRITGYPGAAWIYDAYPIESQKSFKNGIRKFFIVRLIIPIFLVLFAIMIFKIPAQFAALHILFLFAAANLYNSLYNAFMKVLPFTKENTLLSSMQRLTSLFFPLLYGAVITIIMLFVYKSIEMAIITTLIILTVTFWFNYFVFHQKV
ncbi:MAG TPA: hypothetical protein VGK25_09400 [Ignavibacteria bacterium]